VHTLYLDVNAIGDSTGFLTIYPDGLMRAAGSSAQTFTSPAGVSFPARWRS
jgi:hypothetical protein